MVDRQRLTRRQMMALTGAGAAAGLAGCPLGGGGPNQPGGESTPTAEPSTLPPVHLLTDYNNDAWQAKWEDDLVPAFTDETGVDVEVTYSGTSGSQESQLATLVQAGDPPAINTSTFDQVADLWAADQLASTTDVVEQVESVAGDLMASPFRNEDGDIWEVPHGYYTSNFHYREDVYAELSLDVPETFQDVLENAKAIEESDMDVRGYGLAGGKVGKSQDEFQVYLANMGVSGIGLRWKDPDARDEVEIHFPEEVVTLLEYFQELSQYSADPTSIGWTTSIQNWVAGNFAQQYHLNVWPQGIAGAADVTPIAENTGVAPLPRWGEGGVTRDDVWLYEPTPDGHHVFSGAENTPGGLRFLEWLYGDNIERTAGMYETEPTRFLPDYGDVLASDTFRSFQHWQDFPKHLEDLEYVQNTIVGDYYGNVPESDLGTSAVAVYVTRQWFYGEMVNQVVTGGRTPQEAYEWGYGQLEDYVQEGKQRFDK